MPLWKIAWRSIQRRLLASVLTSLSMALGVMLVVAVLLIIGVVDDSFRNNSSLGYDTIVGAKGGPLQMVLNTVFYLSRPVENLPFDFYQEFLPAHARAPDRTAVKGNDYGPSLEYFDGMNWRTVSGPVTIATGQDTLPVRTSIIADSTTERAEEFTLVVSVTSGNTYNKSARGVGRIMDATAPASTSNDEAVSASVKAEISEAEVSVDGVIVSGATEHAVFGIRLSKPVTADVVMELSLLDGRDGQYAVYVDKVVPVCLGDYYGEFRVVGTTGELFDFVYDVDRKLSYSFEAGRNFAETNSEHGFFEAILGAKVARETGIRVGDMIKPAHGSPEGKAHDEFEVVGILAASGSPVDRAVFVNMEGFNRIRDHLREDGSTEVTSLLVDTRGVMNSARLQNELNEGLQAQAVKPMFEIFKLFKQFVRPMRSLLLLITGMICVVSGVSILVSIYNSMSDRRREIAVMRSLGAGRGTVMAVVLMESVILAMAGGVFGWMSGHALIGLTGGIIEERTGVAVSPFDLAPPLDLTSLLGDSLTLKISSELWLVPGLIILAIIVGFLPALSAYRTDVAKALQSSP